MGTGGTKTILGNSEHKKTNFDVLGTGEHANLFQGNKETGTPGRVSFLAVPLTKTRVATTMKM